jgi:hypothetical protein
MILLRNAETAIRLVQWMTVSLCMLQFRSRRRSAQTLGRLALADEFHHAAIVLQFDEQTAFLDKVAGGGVQVFDELVRP